MAFPPAPVFPKEIDSDYTLFLVHNTAETKICEENPAWSQEIEIIPVGENDLEIWADNGFANISGEMFYYDSVSKNEYGKVHRLKGCARNLSGEQTKWNKKGTWVRGYVVAEHHNQLVDTILKMQDFVGINFDERQKTLDWRIRNLESLEVIFDDFACPDIDFTFNTEEISKEAGILATYSIVIGSAIAATSFRLDFGDGEFTTTELTGTHRYAINARIDPVVTVSNNKCQIIQTPINRENPAEPPPNIIEEFEIPFPECEAIPTFTFVPCEVPEIEIDIPPIILPCPPDTVISLIQGDTVVNISTITTGFTSIIVVGIPSFIDIPPIPPTIIIDPPIPPTIIIIPPDSEITLNLDASNLPEINVNWGAPPDMQVQMAMVRPVQNMRMLSQDDLEKNEFGTEFADIFQAQNQIKVEYEPIELPSEILLVAPEIPKIEFADPPKIQIDTQSIKLPDIRIAGPDEPIPVQLNLVGENIPDEIELVYKGDPIKLETTKITIEMEKDIPDRILIEQVEPIKIDASDIPKTIAFEGGTIELVVPENIGVPLTFPEKMPDVEMVYKGAPIELKITMDDIMAASNDGSCVMIVPCSR